MSLTLTRPLCIIDLETTGTDPATARIIEFGVLKIWPETPSGDCRSPGEWSERFNPQMPIPPEATAVHGIRDEDVAHKWPFSAFARRIHLGLQGCDLAGYNLTNYDVPLLWEEFYRAGIEWDLGDTRIIDVRTIWVKREPRTLTDAVYRFAGRSHDEAHGALEDAVATRDVLEGQLQQWTDIEPSVDALAALSRYDDGPPRIDLAGKLVRDQDGDAAWTIGNFKGKKLRETQGFADWVLGKDFPANTKMAIRAELARIGEAVTV